MFVYEGPRSVWFGSSVEMLPDDREIAWAQRSMKPNPAHKFFLGRYVEADNANSNRQFWSLEALRASKNTIVNSPVNLAHRAHNIVGHYVDAELMYPTAAAVDDSIQNPFVETLGVLYKYYYRDEVAALEAAYERGQLFQSMECVADTVTCAGDRGCGKEVAYKGPRHDSYCACLNEGPGVKQFNNPIFLGGGLLVPPIMPGWQRAQIKDLAQLVEDHATEMDLAYEGLANEFSHLTSQEWEIMMLVLAEVAHGQPV